MILKLRSIAVGFITGLLLALAAVVPAPFAQAAPSPSAYAGSRSCIECHERFYRLWSTSFHGLAMQPYTQALAASKLSAQKGEISIEKYRYRVEISGGEGWVYENGPTGRKRYKIEHVLGGKNVYYFLSQMEKGRLQTLPLAYDVRKKQWYDMAGSGMRHFPGRRPDTPVNWKDWPYTFNTACHSCHVSQLSTNYDLKTDTYYQNKKGDSKAAARTLEDLLNRQPAFADGYLMLADIRFQKGDRKGAEQVLEKALDVPSLSQGDRANIQGALQLYRAGGLVPPSAGRVKP